MLKILHAFIQFKFVMFVWRTGAELIAYKN